MNKTFKWLKEHIGVLAFLFTIFSSLIAFVVYLDTEQDVKLARQVVEPVLKDVHDEIIMNRQELLTSREHTLENSKKLNELEKQTTKIGTQLDTMLKMLEDGKKAK